MRSARSHRAPRSGVPGLPSKRTIEAGVSSTPTRKFHIIQPVVVNQKTRSPSWASRCRCTYFRCSSRIPPWLWTIGLGRPVVPELKSSHSGCSNGSCSKLSGSSRGDELRRASRWRPGSRSAPPRRRSRRRCPPRPRCDRGRAAVAVAVDRQQDLRLDLREAIDHRPRAELGRRARPHGADRGRGEEGRDRLGDVGHVGRDAVARAHPEPPQPGGDAERSARAARPTSTATGRAARWRGGWPPRRRRGRGRSARRRTAATPGNHCAPGISRRPSTRSYGVEACTSKNSQTAPQKPSRSSTDQRHSSS